MSDILQAARSYYGLSDTESCTTQLYTNQAGQACVAFEIALSNEDFAAIVERMKAMQQEESQQADLSSIPYPVPDSGELRRRYNALSKVERGYYGSFARYVADEADKQAHEDMLAAGEGRQVVHVDATEEPEPVSMDAVWLDEEEATQAQKQFAIDYCENDGYYVQWAMLTDEQKQKAKESGK